MSLSQIVTTRTHSYARGAFGKEGFYRWEQLSKTLDTLPEVSLGGKKIILYEQAQEHDKLELGLLPCSLLKEKGRAF